MSSKQVFYLNNMDPDDVHDVFLQVEESFGITFTQRDMDKVRTLGDLCTIVHNKIKLVHQDSCTTQQAFYKLRGAVTKLTGAGRQAITPATSLTEIFPENERLQIISVIEKDLDLELNILRPKQTVTGAITIGFIISLIAFFFSWQVALCGLFLCTGSALLAGKFGTELCVKTFGQLAEKIAREHYIKCRRSVSTLNRNEIDKKIQQLFQHELDLDPSVLTPQATFN